MSAQNQTGSSNRTTSGSPPKGGPGEVARWGTAAHGHDAGRKGPRFQGHHPQADPVSGLLQAPDRVAILVAVASTVFSIIAQDLGKATPSF